METGYSIAEIAKAPKIYKYLGGTFNVSAGTWYFTGAAFLWIHVQFVGSFPTFATPQGWFWIGFILWAVGLGVAAEWAFRDRLGRIVLNSEGLTCTLPWNRERTIKWIDIRKVRCTSFLSVSPAASHWEIVGRTPRDRITFQWELKGYKEMLATIKNCAPNLEQFDTPPDEVESTHS